MSLILQLLGNTHGQGTVAAEWHHEGPVDWSDALAASGQMAFLHIEAPFANLLKFLT